MRVNGRVLRPSNLAERRFMLSLGVEAIRVPRKENPYVIARRLSRTACSASDDVLFARELIARRHRVTAADESSDGASS